MSAYIVGHVEITNPEVYAEYMKHTPRLVAAHGGRFIARGGDVEVLEGEPEPRRMVILEFPSAQAARDFFTGDDYAPYAAMRQGASNAQFVLLDEFPTTEWEAAVAASNEHAP